MATNEPYQTALCVRVCGPEKINCRKKEHTLYRVRYYKPDGLRTDKRGFKTVRDAEAFAATVEVSKMDGTYVAPSLGKITIGELAPGFLEKKEASCARSWYLPIESAWRCHVKERWGNVAVADVELDAVETWIAKMTKAGSGATTVIRAYGVLVGILDTAVKQKRLRANPAKGVENLPKKTGKRHVYLTAEDVAALANESKFPVLVLTLAYTGIRWGEAVGMRVRDIDFLRRRLTVADNVVQLGVEHVEGDTKSHKVRSVPVPQFVLDELSVLCKGKKRDALVFPHPTDPTKYMTRPKHDGGWFQGAVKRSGVQHITPHDLRHSCASLAVSAGVNVLALARMLGHEDPSVTLRVYSDLFDDDLDRAAEALHARYRDVSTIKKPA